MSKKNNANFIILMIVGLLFVLLMIVLFMLEILQNPDTPSFSLTNTTVSTNTVTTKRARTVKEVIESYGSKFLRREKNIFIEIYVDFKYDLFDEQGKSKKTYFYDIIEDIVEIEKDSFYLRDTDKKIEIFVVYDKEKETYKITINETEDFYDQTNGDIYTNLAKAEITKESDLAINNKILFALSNNNYYYSRTELASEEREDLGNGYFSYQDGAMLARLQSGRAINIIFRENYTETVGFQVNVNTPLEEVAKNKSNLAFGSVKDGYLGYRTDRFYMFLYGDEISVYGYHYKENEYFDQYLSEYCQTGNLEKLYLDFTTEWTNYFEKEYNSETQSVKVSFPTRGIDIDIEGNDSRGIKIYNNYYLTDTVKELIKANKITLEADKDLIHITEQARRESM